MRSASNNYRNNYRNNYSVGRVVVALFPQAGSLRETTTETTTRTTTNYPNNDYQRLPGADMRTTPFLVDPPPLKAMPERRRARPYYHRHSHRQQATLLDWAVAVGVTWAVLAAIQWAGAWPA